MSTLQGYHIQYLKRFTSRLKERKIIWHLLAQVDDLPTKEISSEQMKALLNSDEKNGYTIEMTEDINVPGITTPGDILKVTSGKSWAYAYVVPTRGKYADLGFLGTGSRSPMQVHDTFTLVKDVIANYTDTKPLETSVGRFFLNYLILVEPFGGKIPYINSLWKIGDIENKVADELKKDKVTVAEVKKFLNNVYYLSGFSLLIVPTATQKSFMTDPAIVKRKNELIAQYKDQLHDPLIVKKIEDELLAMDKQFLGNDTSRRFYDAMGKNSYEIHRKKMFLTVGGIESFSADTGKYEFITNSLMEGWNPKDFAAICNEIRKGSYSRGKNTALGGVQSKFMMRIFQDLELTEEDCGTMRTVKVTITDKNARDYIGRTILDGNKRVAFTDENVKGYIGKEVNMRSPVTCETKNGLCYTCCGEVFKMLDMHAISMLAIEISDTFMQNSMKNMHGTKIDTFNVNFEEFFVPM